MLTAFIEHTIISLDFLNGNEESKQSVTDLWSGALYVPGHWDQIRDDQACPARKAEAISASRTFVRDSSSTRQVSGIHRTNILLLFLLLLLKIVVNNNKKNDDDDKTILIIIIIKNYGRNKTAGNQQCNFRCFSLNLHLFSRFGTLVQTICQPYYPWLSYFGMWHSLSFLFWFFSSDK